MNLPLWAQWLQLFATIIIALFAGIISLFQWRTARAKLALDLFEKRFQVFLDVRKVHSELTQLGKLSDSNLPNEIIASGRFLFGPEVLAKLREFHTAVNHLEIFPPSQEHGTERKRIRQDEEAAFQDLLSLFEQYMSMSNKAPVPLATSIRRAFKRAKSRVGL